MKRSTIWLGLACVVGGVASGSAAADSIEPKFAPSNRQVNVLRLLSSQIADARAKSHPVLLPRLMRPGYRPVHGEGASRASGYTFTIAGGVGFTCAGANACTLVIFDAVAESGTPSGTPVRLAKGRMGYYTPMSCGASCSKPVLAWNERGMTYSISGALGRRGYFKLPLMRAANQAIVAGPR